MAWVVFLVWVCPYIGCSYCYSVEASYFFQYERHMAFLCFNGLVNWTFVLYFFWVNWIGFR